MQNQATQEPAQLVSVIIPCYNREDYIVETVQSVLNQTWPNIELIVVDDGCTDGSRALLESFGSRLTILEHPGRVNRGQSAAINLGLSQCNGNYIAILDSDDLFKPTKLEKQVRYLEQHPEVGLVYANGHAVDEHKNILYEFYGSNHKEYSDPNRVLLDCYFLLPNNSLIRAEVMKKAGQFDESLRTAQDHDMAIRVSEITTIGYIPDYLFYYRRHKNSISYTNAKKRWQNGFKILNAACRRYPYPAVVRRKRRAVLHFRLGQCYLQEKNLLKAGYHLMLAGLLDPARAFGVITGREKASSPN